jgi:uncharacterized membrane protein YfcA
MAIWMSAVLFAGGALAGAISAAAGGSSFITFPLLLATGLPPFAAGITNYVALVPSNAVALLGYREELARVRHKLPVPLGIAALGGLIGSLLLLWSGAAGYGCRLSWRWYAETGVFAGGTCID